jgi:hypothetical protein
VYSIRLSYYVVVLMSDFNILYGENAGIFIANKSEVPIKIKLVPFSALSKYSALISMYHVVINYHTMMDFLSYCWSTLPKIWSVSDEHLQDDNSIC